MASFCLGLGTAARGAATWGVAACGIAAWALTACSSHGRIPGHGGEGGGGGETGQQGGAGGPATTAGGLGGSGGGGEGGAGASPATTGQGSTGGGPFVLDPSLYDCTAAKAPVRVNEIPISCATDVTCTTKLLSGHRSSGGSLQKLAPENTVAALHAAIVIGADFVDTDPRVTKDEVLINMYSNNVSKTTNGTADVKDLTLAEIKALTVETLDVNGDEYPGDFSCVKVPTLEEVLAAAKGKIHVLVDADTNNRMDLLVEAILKTETLDWAIIDSASLDKLDQALMLEPTLHVMVRVANKTELSTALAHLADHPPLMVQIVDGASPIVLAPAIHEAGHRVLRNTFSNDAPAALSKDLSGYDQSLQWGVDILQSGRPDLALVALDRWPPPPQP